MRKGSINLLVQIILWIAVALLVIFLIKRYVVDPGVWIFGPGEALLP